MTDTITLPRAVVQGALEVLENIQLSGVSSQWSIGARADAITALREALEQPQQEPVAHLYRDHNGQLKLSQISPQPRFSFPVYTTPPRREWVGLTLDEWREIDNRHDWRTTQGRIDATEEVDAKLKEKNYPDL